MESKWLYVSLMCSTLIALVYKLFFDTRARAGSRKLPPSPPAARPFLGHLHLLENPLHRTLHKLSLKHGPILSLRFGSRLVVVVSSPTAIEECFTKNDANFANRPHLTMNRHLGYNYTALVSASYGDHWRNLRRLCSLEIFSPGRLNMFLSTREEEVKHLLSSLYKMSSIGFTSVRLRSKLCEVTFNNITRMVAGKRYYGDAGGIQDKVEAKQFQELISATFKFSGASNAGDFLPLLRWIDYKGIEKNMSIISKKMDKFLQGLINERRQCNNNDTMIDHLLSFQQSQPGYYTDEIIKGLVLVMLIGGTNTSETTMEWAMSLLVNHPEVLKKARDEIDFHVGFDRFIKEEDLSKLHYLNNIVSETLRLFPALPSLVPHESSHDCKLGGYDVPRGTIILANVWAVHRDPELWEEPDCFKPERFEGKEIEAHKFLPFGTGRRVCPGAVLGQRVMGLALGSLIQSFEWRRVNEEKVDLAEGTGLAMPKANPLVVMCKPRQVMDKVFKNMI
ncbi:cytochrome P450 81Q32-like [Tasmannia lanceolata]|uniref:cytochrome P450 81Q32-like n=1 Tax=Tasmannia lanceolata TaxID=3420 RepID=UPI004063C74B